MSAPATTQPYPPDTHETQSHSTWRADAWLVAATIIWGTSFVIIKRAVTRMDPFVFLSLRFGAGALVYALVMNRRAWPHRRELIYGAWLGLFLWAGNVCQTLGLQTVTPSRSAFLTSLSVVFVPLLVVSLWRRIPPPGIWAAVVLALAGLTVLYRTAVGFTFARGDLLTLACAVIFSGHILVMGTRGSAASRPLALCAVQLVVCAALMWVIEPFAASQSLATTFAHTPREAWYSIAFLASVGTVVPFALQAAFQPRSTPSRAAVIFTLEPVFATVFAAITIGTVLTAREITGSALLLSSMFVAELWRGRER
jgi:drug/metabolite transporter (DMT)-like permease